MFSIGEPLPIVSKLCKKLGWHVARDTIENIKGEKARVYYAVRPPRKADK